MILPDEVDGIFRDLQVTSPVSFCKEKHTLLIYLPWLATLMTDVATMLDLEVAKSYILECQLNRLSQVYEDCFYNIDNKKYTIRF